MFLISSKFFIAFGIMAFLDNFSISMVTVGLVPFLATVWHLGPRESSMFLVGMGLGTILGLILVMRPVVARCGELVATKVGYALTGLSFLLLGFGAYSPSPMVV